MHPRAKATVEDLYRVPDNGKAELIDGEIVRMSPTGVIPGRASGEIYIALRDYERSGGNGYAFPDNVGFVVDLSDGDYGARAEREMAEKRADYFAAGTLVV